MKRLALGAGGRVRLLSRSRMLAILWLLSCSAGLFAKGTPHTITLLDGLSGAPLAKVKVEARKVSYKEGKLTEKKVAEGTTGPGGVVVFNLDGRREHRLRVLKPFNDRDVYTMFFTPPSPAFEVAIGPVEITALDATVQPPLEVGGIWIDFDVLNAGTWQPVSDRARTGRDGRARFDLPGLGTGTTYRPRVSYGGSVGVGEPISGPSRQDLVLAGSLAPPPPANWRAYHVLNRATFGGTPAQLAEVAVLAPAQVDAWADAFLKEQLELDPRAPWPANLHDTTPLPAPAPIDDAAFDAEYARIVASWPLEPREPTLAIPAPGLYQLQDADLARKSKSRRQLLEVMTAFWENHFNTDFHSHGQGQFEVAENEAFRRLAFGKFLDLVLASGKGTAMVIYLDSHENRRANPNENYARELLELHTLGKDANGNPDGYTQVDVVEAAKCFTGWNKTPGPAGGFRFQPGRHSPKDKLVLGHVIPFRRRQAGVQEGEEVIALAASHPSTAAHLARKLCRLFVSDTPSAALLAETASVFTDSGGDIKKVLVSIFTSPEFHDVRNYRAKVKTPLELAVGIRRNLGVWSKVWPFRRRLALAGNSTFDYPTPEGYGETASDWLSSNVLYHETALAYESAIIGFGPAVRFGPDQFGRTRLWLLQLGLSTEDEVIGYLLNLTVDTVATAEEWRVYRETLREGLAPGAAFSLKDWTRELALDRLLATILASPGYLYQ